MLQLHRSICISFNIACYFDIFRIWIHLCKTASSLAINTLSSGTLVLINSTFTEDWVMGSSNKSFSPCVRCFLLVSCYLPFLLCMQLPVNDPYLYALLSCNHTCRLYNYKHQGQTDCHDLPATLITCLSCNS